MRTTYASWLLLAMMGLGSSALAVPVDDESGKQTDDSPNAQESEDSGDGGLLAGPKVDEEPASDDNPAFGGEERARQTTQIPPGRWFLILQEIELSDEQRAEANAIAEEYEQAASKFRAETRVEMRQLQDEIDKAREANLDDPKLRERYREIQSKAPPPQAYQDRIWQILNAEQQEVFRAKLEEARQAIAERRAREQEERLNARRGEMSGEEMTPGGDMTGAEPGRGPRARRGERVGQGLDAMSQKRFEFLMSKRSKNAPDRPAGERMRERRRAGNSSNNANGE